MADVSTEIRIQDNSHAINCFEELHSLWKSQQLCDLTLKIAEMEFKVHKLILVSCSKYFKNMFTQDWFVEKGKKYVELHQVDPNAFRIILEYFYSGYIVISEDTVDRVLATADFLSLTALKSICAEYLLNNIDINNAISRYCIGVRTSSEELECKAKSFILNKLDEVSKTPHFHKINQGTLKELLTTTKVDANGEQIYTAISRWAKYDVDNRKLFLSDLLHLIPTENISHDFYMNSMKNEKILRQDFKCTNWLLDNFADKFDRLYVGMDSLETKLFITNQFNDKSECFQLELQSNELKTLSARPDIVAFSAISYKNSIYLTAGQYNNRDLEKSYIYDSDENSWSAIKLNFDRCGACACILHDQLFIAGGYNNQSHGFLNSCICYDFNSNQKLLLPQMNEKRRRPGTSTYNNSVYVCCGWNGSFLNWMTSGGLSCIERYDPREGQWQNVGKYKFVRGWCSSAVISDYLYTSRRSDAAFERFDFRNNSSEELAKPVEGFWSWSTSSQGKFLRVHGTGLSEYDVNSNHWLNKEYNFKLNEPIVTPWDST